VKHPACPQWGLGYLIEERDDKRFYDFEDGMSHSIARAFWSKLEPVELGGSDLAALEAKIRGLKVRSTSSSKARARPVGPPPTTFPEQLARFERELPGGFEGEAFVKEERGALHDPNSEKKQKANKTQAVATAARALAKAELEALAARGDFAGIVTRVREVHKAAAGLLHPLGDIIPFTKMPAEHDEGVGRAVVDLLHGSDEFDARFDRFVAALATAKVATWPLATILPALVDPKAYCFVKPSYYEKQAHVMGIDIGYERVPSAAVYGRMQSLARTLQQKLEEAGQKPRDLLDVYAFIARTTTPEKVRAPASEKTPKK
jgi:hypothetical protein